MHVTNEDHSHCGCGCGGHEHDHDHDHCHEHTHEHSHGDVTHSHPHCHEEGHEHDHDHVHGEQPKDEDTAVLAYMLDHNRHHAQELSAIAQHLREAGKEEAAVQVEKGVEDFEKGNMRLSIALSLIQ